MSVRVRLTRVGSKKNPVWRVVVADQRSPRDGRIIESIGHYNPQTEPSTIVIDRDRLQHWIDQGAQPTNTVRKLMRAPDTVAPAPKAAAASSAEAAPAAANEVAEPAAATAGSPEVGPEPDAAPESQAITEPGATTEPGASPEGGEAGTLPVADESGDSEAPAEGDDIPAGTADSDSDAGPSGAAVESSETAQPPGDAEAGATTDT